MPNWCVNNLTVIVDQDEHAELYESLTTGPEFGLPEKPILTFSKIVPEPNYKAIEHEHELREDPNVIELSGMPYWYDWRVNNWGTKWDAHDAPVYIAPSAGPLEDGTHPPVVMTCNFQTAWGPPVEFVTRASEKFPNAVWVLSYDEPGMDFGGYVMLKAGEEIGSRDGASRMWTWDDTADEALDDYMHRQNLSARSLK